MGAVRTILAFDFGHKRIGVAVGQDLTGTARALETITVPNGRIDWDAIAALVDAWRPEQFVLGRPRTADGSPHILDHAIERFARRLQGRYGRPVSFIDEHLSSHAARTDPECSRAGLDAVAARLILESWFASEASWRRRRDDTSGRNT